MVQGSLVTNGTIGYIPMVPLATNGTIGKIYNGTIGRLPNARYINDDPGLTLTLITAGLIGLPIHVHQCRTDRVYP